METSRRKGAVARSRADESRYHRVKIGGAQSGDARTAMHSAANARSTCLLDVSSGSAGAKKPAEQPLRKTVGNHKGNIGMAGTIEKSLLAVALLGIVLPHAGWAHGPSRQRREFAISYRRAKMLSVRPGSRLNRMNHL